MNQACPFYVSVHLSTEAMQQWSQDVHLKLTEEPDYHMLIDTSPMLPVAQEIRYYLDVFDEYPDSPYRLEILEALSHLEMPLESVSEIYFSGKDNFILLEIDYN